MTQVIKMTLHTEYMPHLLRRLESRITYSMTKNRFQYRCDLSYILHPTDILKQDRSTGTKVKRLKSHSREYRK